MHKDMQHIIQRDEPTWKEALSNVKGIYVITDTSNGNLYIGSASGNTDGIWQRWSCYASLNNLTGGNKEFIKILNEKGSEYITLHFRYSIIEIFDTKTKVVRETIRYYIIILLAQHSEAVDLAKSIMKTSWKRYFSELNIKN